MDDRRADRIAGLSPTKQALLALRRAREQGTAGDAITATPARGDAFPLRASAPRGAAPAKDGLEALVSERLEAPVSFAQERFWFLHALDPLSPAYGGGRAFRLQGALDRPALERGIAEVVRRHEVLRTTFATGADGQPLQVIAASLDVPLHFTDLTPLPLERLEAARRLAVEAMERPCDLERGPLMRAQLMRLGPEDHVLFLAVHHIVSDAWSSAVLLREIATVYEAARAGRSWQLPALAVQYRDFAAWQRDALSGGHLDGDLAYWRRKLGGGLPEALLPADRPWPAVRTYAGRRERLTLSPALTHSLVALGRQEGASLFMILVAAVQAMVGRYTGGEDVIIGCPVAVRDRIELEPLLGCFLNTLALRTDLSGNPTFRELLRRAREVALEAYEHQDLPIERLLAELRPMRHGSRAPLFQFMLNMHEIPEELALPGLRVERLAIDRATALFEMTLYFHRSDAGLALTLAYNTDLFDPERARDVLAQLEGLLRQVVQEPDRRLDALSLVTQAAGAALPDPRAPLDRSWKGAVHEGFARQARRAPERTSVLDPAGAWTYGELERQSNRIAHYLRSGGGGAERVVAIYAHRSAPLVAAVLGVLKAGAAFMILDPAYPERRLLECVRQARPHAWIEIAGAPVLPAELARVAASLPCRCRLGPGVEAVTADGRPLSAYPIEAPDVSVGPETLACVTFTSGSTGQPRGVAGLHGSLSHFLPWQVEAFGFTEEDRFSMLSGLAHDPLQRDIFTPLWAGAAIGIPDPDGIMTPGWLSEWMARSGITVIQLTPAMLQLVVETAPEGVAGALSQLRLAFTVGEALTRRDVERLRELAPRVTHVNYYGATETQRALGYFVVPPDVAPGRDVIPLGRGLPGAQLLVLNRAGGLAGVGELGEIHVRSPHLARGYVGDEPLTRERFLVNPFTGRPEDRLYRTGDLGRYLPDGAVEFAGRNDHQVKIRGFRIEPGEIEAALAAHPDVRESVVVAREDGTGDMRLVAYIVAAAPLQLADLRPFLGQRVPAYMVPASFVVLDGLPLTLNGKVDRAALPPPESAWLDTGEGYVAPRNELERELAAIWAAALGVERVGVTQSFFELGGHSLLAVRLCARVEKRFGRRPALATLFRAPTVEQQAGLLREEAGGGWRRSLVAIQPRGANPPLYCVPGHAGTVLCFQELARRLAPEQPMYGLEPRGLDDGAAPRTRVEDVAADYVREIREVQPRGPYYLGGFCFGGQVAYEMAQQLMASGERVGLLALFDARGRGEPDGGSTLLRRAGRRLAVEYVNLRPLPTRDRLAYAWAQGQSMRRRMSARLRRRLGVAPAVADPRLAALGLAQAAAARAYVARPYPGAAVVFVAQRRNTRHYLDPLFGWGKLVTGRLEVRLIPIAEGSVIQHPEGARAIAAELFERIRLDVAGA